jgi:HNH endonuclease
MDITLQNKIRLCCRVHESGCWLWTKSLSSDGYAQIQYNWRRLLAHVAAYIAFKGEPTPGKIIMHTCDIKHCVNPGHLKEGTYAENMQDAARKNRMARGSRNGNAILTEEKVRLAIKLRKEGLTLCAVGSIIGCSNQTVSAIEQGKIWRSVTNL